MSESTSGYLSPDEITNKAFDTKRRGGFDPDAVRQHLASVSATVNELLAERASLSEQIATLEQDLAVAKSHTLPSAEMDEDELTERIGKDAARVLAEARAAAADRIAEAETQADDIRAAAEEVFAERSQRADEEANRIHQRAELARADRTAEAEQAAAQILARAEVDADSMRSSIAGERQSADAEAARIVREAELTRRQILEDLARRRSAARRQIEQLRAGRERLLASHETVRRALDDISEELTISMSEARAAAETAGHSVSETTIEELEAEIETARLTGLLDTGPVPVVAPPAVPPPVRATEEATDQAAEPSEPVSAPVDEGRAEAIDEPAQTDEDVGAAEESEPAAERSSDTGLADVVQLDRARNDVDTATHPATGRDSSASRGNTRSTVDEPKAPTLEAVEPLAAVDQGDPDADDLETEHAVDDLFASLRSTTPVAPKKSGAAAPKKTATKKPAAKKSATKKTAAKKTAAKKSPSSASAKSAALPDVDSSDLARRLKRVLADEQSRAMAHLKTADVFPTLEELLGDEATHPDGYWAEVVGQVDGVSASDDEIRRPVEELVESIRYRVGEVLEEADGDSDSAISALRSTYREVKTQRVTVCAADVCQLAATRPSERS